MDLGETHAVQILDEPHQTLTLQAGENALIEIPAKEVAQLLVKLWRSLVEVTELL